MGGDGKGQVFFNVPANKCGLVIGKGGETIRQINAECDVHCELDRNPPANPMEKTFIIRGPPEQIDQAKRMICEKAGMVRIFLFKVALIILCWVDHIPCANC